MTNFFRAQLLTLTLSWVLALGFILLGGSLYSFFFIPFIFIYYWIPGLVALYFYQLEKMRIPIRFQLNSGFLWAGLISVVLGGFIILLSLPFSELRSMDYLKSIFPLFLSHFTPFTMIFLFTMLGVLFSLILGFTLYLPVAGGQEIMWRGYMWDKLKGFGFWKSALIIGFFSGIWRTPLILIGDVYPEHSYIGIPWIIIFSILLSPLLLYYRLQTRSVLGSAVFYGVLSSFTNVSVYLFVSPNYLMIGKEGVTGFIACLLFNLLLFIKVKKNPLLEYEI
jgi:hypothetical protein